MPHALDLAVAATSHPFVFPDWAVFLVVLVALPLVLLLVWLAYSCHKGSLGKGGEIGVTRKLPPPIVDQVGG